METPEAKTEKPHVSVTEHTITINGRVLKYKATAGYLVQSEEPKDDGEKPKEDDHSAASEGGKPKARIFYIAYTLEGQDARTRPVTFAFNGGPGAASVWLHLGALGPRRVKLDQLSPNSGPPYSLVDNDASWLPETDLVFIDPVSTGYSRPVPGEKAGDFHTVKEDVKSVGQFIRLYTTQNDRWPSPKFIVGESYGGTRAAAVCSYLQDEVNLYVNGVIIVSGLLTWENVDFSTGNDIAYALALPSFASTAWYYKKDAPEYQQRNVSDVRKEAEEFATKDYLLALAQGDQLPEADRQAVAMHLSKLTGLPADLILRYRLRIKTDLFRQEVLKNDGRAPGRFDSRYSAATYNPEDIGDPSFAAVRGAFTAAINSYLRSELKFESDLSYETLIGIDWKFESENKYLDVADPLGYAMSENPRLKLWVTCGYYDLAVAYFSTEFTLDHLHLDPSLRSNVTLTKYETGHMLYLDQPTLKALHDDFSRFVKSAVP